MAEKLFHKMMKKLTTAEVKEFVNWATPNQFGLPKKCSTYLKLLSKHHPEMDETAIEADPKINKLLPAVPQKKETSDTDKKQKKPSASNSELNKLNSGAKKLLEKFLIFKELETQPHTEQLLLLDAFLRHSLDGELWKNDSPPDMLPLERHRAYAKYQFVAYEILQLERGSSGSEALSKFFHENLLPALDRLILQEKLRHGCQAMLILSKTLSSGQSQIPLLYELDLILPLHERLIAETPVLWAFFQIFQMLRSPDSARQLLHFETWFDEKIQQQIPANELRDLFNLLLNLQTQRMNRGEYRTLGELRQFYGKQTEFFQKLEALDFLTEGQFIQHRRFKNAISAAVNSGQLDWARGFLKRNIGRVLPEHREALDDFSRGTLAFYAGDFKKAQEYFFRLPPLDDFYFFDVHTMRVRMSFEENDPDQMRIWRDQIREKLNQKTLPLQMQTAYEQFFRFLEELFKFKKVGKKISPDQSGELYDRIEKTPVVTQKKWLLEAAQRL